MTSENEPKLATTYREIMLYPIPGEARQDGEETPLDCITVDTEYVHMGEAGIAVTGCWTVNPIHDANDGNGEFIIGSVVYPWHRIAWTELVFHTTSDEKIRANGGRDDDPPTAEQLAEWAKEWRLDAAKLQAYYDRFVGWSQPL